MILPITIETRMSLSLRDKYLLRQPIQTVQVYYNDITMKGAYHGLMWSLCVKFHDCMCDGKAIMCQLPFSVISAL